MDAHKTVIMEATRDRSKVEAFVGFSVLGETTGAALERTDSEPWVSPGSRKARISSLPKTFVL